MSDNIELIKELVLPKRLERVREVVKGRTKNVTVALEAVEISHNQSAALRTCDAFGIQDVHMVTSQSKKFRPHRLVTQGAHKWLDIHQHKTGPDAIRHLKEQGYQVWASTLQEDSLPLHKVDMTQRIALFFGNEHEGLSQESLALCDGSFVIPMIGFSQSFNVSVAAALTLYEVYRQRIERWGTMGDLTEEEQENLYETFVSRSIKPRLLRSLRALSGKNNVS